MPPCTSAALARQQIYGHAGFKGMDVERCQQNYINAKPAAEVYVLIFL